MIRAALRLAGVTMASSVANGIIAVITARALGADGRGVIVLAITAIGLTSLIGSLGVNTAARYFLARGSGLVSVHTYWTATLLLTFVSSALLASVIIGTLEPSGFSRTVTTVVLVYGVVSFLGYMVRDAMNAFGFIARSAVVFAANCWASLGLVAGSIFLQPTVHLVIVAMTVGSIIEIVYDLYFLRREGISLTPGTDVRELRLLVRRGVPALGLNAGQSLTFRVDRYIIGLLLGPAAVGVYSVAATLSEILRMVPAAFGQLLLRRVAVGDGDEAATARIKRRLLLGLVPPLILLAVFAEPLVAGLFGPGFQGAVPILRILILGEIAIMSFHIDSRQLVGMGLIGRAGAVGLFCFAAVVLLDLVLIPTMGLTGAAVASVVAYWLLGGLTAAIVARGTRK